MRPHPRHGSIPSGQRAPVVFLSVPSLQGLAAVINTVRDASAPVALAKQTRPCRTAVL